VKNGMVIYYDCFQTFIGKEDFFEEDYDKFFAKILFGIHTKLAII
jgi:hypothetical protein